MSVLITIQDINDNSPVIVNPPTEALSILEVVTIILFSTVFTHILVYILVETCRICSVYSVCYRQ